MTHACQSDIERDRKKMLEDCTGRETYRLLLYGEARRFTRHLRFHSNATNLQNLSLSLFPVAPTLEHRASVKRFVSHQFLNPKTVWLLGWAISPLQGRYLYRHRINTDKHPCLEWDNFQNAYLIFGTVCVYILYAIIALCYSETG
jgi:hypothetical protein